MTDDWVAAVPARVWQRIAEALERRGLAATGAVTVVDLSRSERHTVGGLLGRPVLTDRCRIDLAQLDRRLRERAPVGGGLVKATQSMVGRALVDRPGVRSIRERRLGEPASVAWAWLEENEGDVPAWAADWMAGLRRDGVLARLRDPVGDVVQALEVLDAVGDGGRTWSRTDLAATVTGSSHSLDDGEQVAGLVLRALALRTGESLPTDTFARRSLWERAGVVADGVSSTCLTVGLRVVDAGDRERAWNEAAERGDPVHLTPWDLARSELVVSSRTVLVCENPRVLEAVAERCAGGVAVVCTNGRPALVTLEVLRRCVGTGAALRYHGDFDWAGVAIANQVIEAVGASPWRMDADDYLGAPAGLPLTGSDVEPSWSTELGPAMRRRGTAVHEEAVLTALLDELDPP